MKHLGSGTDILIEMFGKEKTEQLSKGIDNLCKGNTYMVSRWLYIPNAAFGNRQPIDEAKATKSLDSIMAHLP